MIKMVINNSKSRLRRVSQRPATPAVDAYGRRSVQCRMQNSKCRRNAYPPTARYSRFRKVVGGSRCNAKCKIQNSKCRRNACSPTARLRRVLQPPANPAVDAYGRRSVQCRMQNSKCRINKLRHSTFSHRTARLIALLRKSGDDVLIKPPPLRGLPLKQGESLINSSPCEGEVSEGRRGLNFAFCILHFALKI